MKPSVAAVILTSLLSFGTLLAHTQQRLATVPLAPAVEVQCVEVLRSALKSGEFWPSMHAAEALTLAGKTDEVRATLAPLLPKERDDQRRCGLARELRAPAIAINWQSWNKSWQMAFRRVACMRPRASTNWARLVAAIICAAHEQGANRPLQLWATAALAQSGDKTCLAELRAALRSDQAANRSTAAFALARLGDSDDVEPLASALATETDPVTRVMLAGALACRGHEGGRAELGASSKAPT